MEYWLKENRKFLMAVGAMALSVLVLWIALLRPLDGAASREANKQADLLRAYRARTADGVPADAAVGQAEAELRARKDRLAELTRLHHLPLAEKFTTKDAKASGYKEQFDSLKLEVRDDLSKLNESAGLGEFPQTLGFDTLVIDGEEAARDALLRLGVADAAVKSAIKVMKLNDRFLSIDISLPGRGEGDVFVRRAPVKLRVSGALKSLFEIVHALQREPFLSLDAFAVTGSALGGQENFEAEFVVSGLFVDPEKPLKRQEGAR